MIDRPARDKLAEAVPRLLELGSAPRGERLSREETEAWDKLLSEVVATPGSKDAGISPIGDLLADLAEIPEESLPGGTGRIGRWDRRRLLRCAAFLHSDREYAWPRPSSLPEAALALAFLWLTVALVIAIALHRGSVALTGLVPFAGALLWLNLEIRRQARRLAVAGDQRVWPFVTLADCQAEAQRQDCVLLADEESEAPLPDLRARWRLALLIGALRSGELTSVGFRREAEPISIGSEDPALDAIFTQVGQFADASLTHRLRGRFGLDEAAERLFDRCLAFLSSEAPYDWPLERVWPYLPPPRAWGRYLVTCLLLGVLTGAIFVGYGALWLPSWGVAVALVLMCVTVVVVVSGPARAARRGPSASPGMEWWPFHSEAQYAAYRPPQGHPSKESHV